MPTSRSTPTHGMRATDAPPATTRWSAVRPVTACRAPRPPLGLALLVLGWLAYLVAV